MPNNNTTPVQINFMDFVDIDRNLVKAYLYLFIKEYNNNGNGSTGSSEKPSLQTKSDWIVTNESTPVELDKDQLLQQASQTRYKYTNPDDMQNGRAYITKWASSEGKNTKTESFISIKPKKYDKDYTAYIVYFYDKEQRTNQTLPTVANAPYMFIFPLFADTLTNNYGFNWNDDELGQLSAGQVMTGVGVREALKTGLSIAETWAKGKFVINDTGKKIIDTVKSVGEGVSNVINDPNFQNAMSRQTGKAFVKPKKKIFQGTNYLTFNYDFKNMIPKNKKAHYAMINAIKLIQILTIPSMGEAVKGMFDSAISGVLGSIGSLVGNENLKNITKDKNYQNVEGTLQVATDLYLYTMDFPHSFFGAIYSGKDLLPSKLLKFFPESAIEKLETSIPLNKSFYDDSDLPFSYDISFTLTEMIPFTKNSSFIFGDADGVTANDLVNNDEDTFDDVYKSKLSIL